MDALQWMGAVRMKVQTADKKHHNNPQVIHTSPSINVLWSEKVCVIINNSIIKMFLA